MLNSILVNKFPSKDHLLLAHNRIQLKSESLSIGSKSTQIITHGCQTKDGGIRHLEGSTAHVNVKHVHFAKGCKEDCTKKCAKSNGFGSKTNSLLDLASNDGSGGEGFAANKSFLTPSWQPRLNYLLEMDVNALKVIHSKTPDNKFVYFCENQYPLNLGIGPDYSCTFLGVMNDGIGVAVKKINKKRVETLSDEGRCQILASINDPSLAKVQFISCDKTHYYIVRELCEHSLAYHLKMRGFIPAENRPPLDQEGLCYKIACAVAALHRLALPHMSLKPENIFVTDAGNVKLADYQLHKRCAAKKKQYANVPSSLAWLPSEAHVNAADLTLASDISALGIIFYWIITEGGHPFGDHLNSLDACMKNCKSGRYNLKSVANPFAHHLLQHMIYKEAEKRLTISDVIKHPYFWTNNAKVEYLQLIASAYCGQSEHSWSIRLKLKQYLMEKECAIRKSNPKAVKQDPMNFTVNSIMRSIYVGILQNDDKPSKEVLQSWPGFVFETYGQFSFDDLKYAQENSTANLNCQFELKECSLKPCLSVDSGVHMTYNEYNSDSNDPFTCTNGCGDHPIGRQRFISGDSGCCSYSDPGIDLMSPIGDFLKEESCFEFPDYSDCNTTTTDNLIDEECCNKVFRKDFNISDSLTRKNENLMEKPQTDFMLWTDMDELD